MRRQIRSYCIGIAAAGLLLSSSGTEAKTKSICDDPKPESLCNLANTCGSASEACTIDVRRSGNGATVKPKIPNAKGNQFFCIKTGTTVVWTTSSKRTGFSVSFGTAGPFGPNDPIVGGATKPITVTAQNPGCYKYDAGAFTSGTVHGMSGGTRPELLILP